MFASTWSWLVPVLGAAIVLGFVLATTPPGLSAVGSMLFSSGADPAAYATGAAASLALLTLVALGAVCAAVDRLLR